MTRSILLWKYSIQHNAEEAMWFKTKNKCSLKETWGGTSEEAAFLKNTFLSR